MCMCVGCRPAIGQQAAKLRGNLDLRPAAHCDVAQLGAQRAALVGVKRLAQQRPHQGRLADTARSHQHKLAAVERLAIFVGDEQAVQSGLIERLKC